MQLLGLSQEQESKLCFELKLQSVPETCPLQAQSQDACRSTGTWERVSKPRPEAWSPGLRPETLNPAGGGVWTSKTSTRIGIPLTKVLRKLAETAIAIFLVFFRRGPPGAFGRDSQEAPQVPSKRGSNLDPKTMLFSRSPGTQIPYLE